MIDVAKIKLLLPDPILASLTDDEDTGQIKEDLITQIIEDGYRYIDARLPNADDAIRDEFVKNYVLSNLYAYAGMDEKARGYQEIYLTLLDSFQSEEHAVSQISVSSRAREFTEDELGKW